MNLYLSVYNFCNVHGTLMTSPAVAAGLTDYVRTVRELLEQCTLTQWNWK